MNSTRTHLLVAPRAQASRLSAWLLLALLWLGAIAAQAQEVPPRPDPPRLVNDLAHVMQPQEVDALEQKLVAYDDSTSSQIAVVTVPSLGNSDIFSYAQKLYQTWGIGRKGKDNGLLLLVAVQEHQVRVHTGQGLEGAVPDALAKRIISNTLAPAFRQNQYYAGLNQGTDQLIALAKGEYKADPADTQRRSRSRDGSGSGIGFWLIIGVLVLLFLLRSRGGGRGGRGGLGGGFIPPIIFGDFSGGRGVFGGGSGGFGGGGGGGGFGGFGGGSSGGGGASGSW